MVSTTLMQLAAIGAAAVGAGLLVAAPSVARGDAAVAVAKLDSQARDWRAVATAAGDAADRAAWLNGAGAGLLAAGLLGLVVPWVNAAVSGRPSPPAGADGPSGPGVLDRVGRLVAEARAAGPEPTARPRAADEACLSCGQPIPASAARCPGCGWSWGPLPGGPG
jgi:hypothetical protein